MSETCRVIDVEYICGFVWWGVCKQSRCRHSVTEASQDGGYVLLWQRYDNNKMAAICYYGNVMATTRWWLCVILHLQQYSHRLNVFPPSCCCHNVAIITHPPSCDGTVTLWRHRLCLQTPPSNETIDVFYINNSTCFGNLYVHLQECRLGAAAYGVQH